MRGPALAIASGRSPWCRPWTTAPPRFAANPREQNPGAVRHDWTREELRALFALPFPGADVPRAGVHRLQFDPTRGADFHAALDQDRRLPGGLRLLSAERALRYRRQGGKAHGARCGARRGAHGKERGREPLLHGRGLARTQGARSRQGVRDGRRRQGARARDLRHARHARRPAQARRLKAAGLDYYNHNLDTSPEYYGAIITTRTYRDRLDTLGHVRAAGIARVLRRHRRHGRDVSRIAPA